jgi:hypothetical protein
MERSLRQYWKSYHPKFLLCIRLLLRT